MTHISIHDATQEEYDRITWPEESGTGSAESNRRIWRWKKCEVGAVEITIFAPK